MRTTVNIPDRMYRRLKSRAAREGTSTRALILKGITAAIDNATIYDVAFPDCVVQVENEINRVRLSR